MTQQALLSPMPRGQKTPTQKRVDAIKFRIASLDCTISDAQMQIEDLESEITECEEEIEDLERELKDLEDQGECTLDPFGCLYPGPGEYGERLLDEATRVSPPPAYGDPLMEMRQ